MTFLLAGFLTVALVSATSIDNRGKNGDKIEPKPLNGISSLGSKLLRGGSSSDHAAFLKRGEQQDSHPGLSKFRRSDSEVPWFPSTTIKRLYDEFPRFESEPESPNKYKTCDFLNAPDKPYGRDPLETGNLRILNRLPVESGDKPAPRVITVKLPQQGVFVRNTINSSPPPSDNEPLDVDSSRVLFYSRFPPEDQNNLRYPPHWPFVDFRNGPSPYAGPFWWILYAQPKVQPCVMWFPPPLHLFAQQPSYNNPHLLTYPCCPLLPQSPFLLEFSGDKRGLY